MSALIEIVEYILTTYENDLKTSRQRWRQDLIDKALLAPNTARALLSGKGGDGTPTKQKLVNWFKRDIKALESIDVTWLDSPSLQYFLEHHHNAPRRATTRIGLEIPRRDDFDAVAEDIVGHFVTYRYAFEAVDDLVAREVVSFSRDKADNAKLLFDMSYTLGADNAKEPLRMFSGSAGVIGASILGIATSTGPLYPGRPDQIDRARSLFLTHDVEPSVDRFAKFGILTSTKLSGRHEPCAACILMFRVDAKIEDLAEFRDKITLIRPLSEILSNDFGLFPADIHEDLTWIIDNRPMEANGARDRVMRLHFERFGRVLQRIHSKYLGEFKDTLTAPWTPHWRKGLLSTRAAKPE